MALADDIRKELMLDNHIGEILKYLEMVSERLAALRELLPPERQENLEYAYKYLNKVRWSATGNFKSSVLGGK